MWILKMAFKKNGGMWGSQRQEKRWLDALGLGEDGSFFRSIP